MSRSKLPVLGSIGAIVIALIGVLAPRAAFRALLWLIVGLAIVAALAALTQLMRRLPPPRPSAFTPPAFRPPVQELPHYISRLAPARALRRRTVSLGAQAALSTVAGERLWSRHGLNLSDKSHHQAIAQLLSHKLWATLQPKDVGVRRALVPARPPAHADIDTFLDELENL